MDVRARPAGTDDLPALAALAAEAIEERRDRRGGALWIRTQSRSEPLTESLARSLADPDSLVVVGTIDDVPVGYAVLEVTTLRDGGLLGVIPDLFTSAQARGVAVGEAMMESLVDRARERGCIGLESVALPGDRETKNFFESHGLVARALIVHRSLEDG